MHLPAFVGRQMFRSTISTTQILISYERDFLVSDGFGNSRVGYSRFSCADTER
jgi:hypothetical protein